MCGISATCLDYQSIATCQEPHALGPRAAACCTTLQEEALLPGVHARVGLALRLDAVERAAAKGHADKTWMRAAAEDLGESEA